MAQSPNSERSPLITDTMQENREKHLFPILKGAAAVGSIALAAFGGHAVYERTISNQIHCNVDENKPRLSLAPGETAWDAAAKPLANELDIPIDEAMTYLSAANHGVNLSNPHSPIVIPTCERGQ